MTDGDRFPIQGGRITSIPWAMISPHEAQALRNHGQTLRRLAERGGLWPGETLLILDDRPWDGRVFVLPRDQAEHDRVDAKAAEELGERSRIWEVTRTPGEPR